MQRREQLLLGGLLAAVVIWQGSGYVASAIFGPFQTKSEELVRLKKSVSQKEDSMVLLARATKTLERATSISLPPDAVEKNRRPDALTAQRLYQTWLTDMAELCEFESTKVTPVRTMAKGDVYVAVLVKLEAQPRYGQLVRFLDQFYRTNLMHRITSMHITAKEFELDPYLTVTLEAEGLALVGAPPRRTLFPQSELAADLSEEGTELRVSRLDDFPKKPGFRVRIKNEFLTVTAVDGEKWTVERGFDQTAPAPHLERTLVELVRQKPDRPDHSPYEFRKMIEKNIFVKPTPPYRLKLSPISDKPFVKGKSNDLTISALGYDSSKGKPEFVIAGDTPSGLKLDKNGKLTWKPGPDIVPEKYSLTFEVRHPSAPQGRLTETLTIRVRDGSATPKLSNAQPPTAFLNREWSFQPEVSAAEAPNAKYTWKLGDKPPEGLKIDNQTGEMKWAPGDAIPAGELSIPVVVTDGDTPPQSTTLALKVEVRDDEASFTRLDIIFRNGDNKRAFLYDASRNRKTELREGEAFAVADLNGTVRQIGRKYIVVALGQNELRIDVGETIREAQTRNAVDSAKNYE